MYYEAELYLEVFFSGFSHYFLLKILNTQAMENNMQSMGCNDQNEVLQENHYEEMAMRHGNTLELIATKYLIRINSQYIEELTQHGQTAIKRELFVRDGRCDRDKEPIEKMKKRSIVSSQFKSPVLVNKENLLPKSCRLGSKLPAGQEEIFSTTVNTDTKECIQNDLSENNSVFLDTDISIIRPKRKSSVVAENKIKKQLEMPLPKEDCFAKTRFESMFCGISKPKKAQVKQQDEPFIFNIFENNNSRTENSIKVLQDKTNSPRKTDLQVEKSNLQRNAALNSKFFLCDDISIENNDVEETVIENIGAMADDGYEKDESAIFLPSKDYYAQRQINTKMNEGYETVEIKKKVIIEIYNGPKSFFRKNNRSRRVHFDSNATNLTHNFGKQITPIINEVANETSEFKWDGEKQTVEVVKRIDLGSGRTREDFVLVPLDKKIES